MTPEETAKAEIRELRHRLREVRTENAELKIQYRRWLILTCCVSMCSLALVLVLVIVPSPKPELPPEVAAMLKEQAKTNFSIPKTKYKDEIDGPSVLTLESGDSNGLIEYEGDTIDAEFPNNLSAPEPEHEEFVSFKQEEKIVEEKKVVPSIPKRAKTFSLPKSKKKVKYHIVKKNDSLWKISMMYYNSYNYVKKIKKDNDLENQILQPGMRLKIVIP